MDRGFIARNRLLVPSVNATAYIATNTRHQRRREAPSSACRCYAAPDSSDDALRTSTIKSLSCSETGLGPLARNRLVDHEMSAHLECAVQSRLFVDDCQCH